MFGAVADAYTTKSQAIRYHGSQEFVMIAGHVDHFGAVFGCTKDAPYHVAVALPPAQAILLHAPPIDDVTYQIKSVSGVVFEKIVEQLGLAVSGTEMHV